MTNFNAPKSTAWFSGNIYFFLFYVLDTFCKIHLKTDTNYAIADLYEYRAYAKNYVDSSSDQLNLQKFKKKT